MDNANNVIVYIYKRNKIDEDEDYISYAYEFVGVSLGNEVENEENLRYFFKPNPLDEKQILTDNFACINDPKSLEYKYVYAFPEYIEETTEEAITELIGKTECDAQSIKDIVLCQIYTKGSESITTYYINKDQPEVFTDVDTSSIDGPIAILANKHEKVVEIQEKLREKFNSSTELQLYEQESQTQKEKQKPNIIYADDIYEFTSRSVICQDEQIKEIAAAIAKNQRIKNPELKDNLLICGPTGVGKSETFRIINKNLGIPIVFEDSTEYTAAGYVGKTVTDVLQRLYENAGHDLEKAQRGIIIFDEIDKKISKSGDHEIYTKAVIDSLLKMAEGHKYHIDTKEGGYDIDTSFITFVVMGAFSGIEQLNEKKRTLGFVTEEEKEEAKKAINQYTEQTLLKYGVEAEFLGRNVVVVMNSLGVDDFCKIIKESDKSVLLLYKYMFEELGIKMIYDESCIEKIAKKANELGVGVRSIKKIIENAFKTIKYQAFSKGHYSELIITPETFDDNKKFILR